MATDDQGYVQYYAANSVKADDSLFTENNLFDNDLKIDGVSFTASAGVTGGATQDVNSKGCNISFDTFMDIDFNLDLFTFDFMLSEFDHSLFDKADAISLEFATINSMLINSIMDMGCCDIAKSYNTTMVPFFQFFADSNNGGEFITMVVRFAEVFTALRAIVEPLECLIRWVPGNPWLPKDIDPLMWIYGYYKESKPFLDRILSGELLDIILNPVHSIRVKMQACLHSGTPTSDFSQILEIGSSSQLEMISALAVQGGATLIESQFAANHKPSKPNPKDFVNGENNQSYQKELEVYKQKILIYERNEKKNAQNIAENERRSNLQNTVNKHLAVSAQTNSLISASTSGICGCVADALGINEIGVELIPIRVSSDFQKLIGQTVNGVTNREVGTTSKNNEAGDDVIITKEVADDPKKVNKIVNAVGDKSTSSKKNVEKKTKKGKENSYSKIIPGAVAYIETEVTEVISEEGVISSTEALKINDSSQKLLDKIIKNNVSLMQLTSSSEAEYRNKWEASKESLKQKIAAAQKSFQLTADGSPQHTKEGIELELAIELYNSHFGTFYPFDMVNDPEDYKILNSYTSDGLFWGLFPDEYWRISKEITLATSSQSKVLRGIPYPPNTPPQNIVNDLPVSTKVDTDGRTYVNYFNAGFVKEKGSSSWRNFNKLDILYSDQSIIDGALSADKTTSYYKAIFPNETIGDNACVSYTRIQYTTNNTIQDYLESELVENSPRNVEYLMDRLTLVYYYEANDLLLELEDADIINIINEISIQNGYELGKLWVKSRRVVPDLEFKSETDEQNTVEYIYTQEGTEDFNISVNGIQLASADINSIFGISGIESGGIAKIAQQDVNKSVQEREPFYKTIIKTEFKLQAGGAALDVIRHNILSSIATMLPQKLHLNIPCTCDNFLCMLLNTIIQYVFSALNRLIQEVLKMIVQFLIPDWVRDLLRMIQDFLKCFMSIFGIVKTIADIHQYAEELLESMRDRIRYYPADACFVAEPGGAPINLQPGDDGWPQPPEPPEYPLPLGEGCLPTEGQDCGPMVIPGYPPIIVDTSVVIIPGDPGRDYPGFQMRCDYLEL